MPNPAILYYAIKNYLGINTKVSTFIVIVSDGHSARQNELKIPNNQDPDDTINQRLQQLWQTGEDTTMQAFRVASQRNDNNLLNELIDAMYVAFSTHATPDASMIFTAAETVILPGTPRHDEWVKHNIMLKNMTGDERVRYQALINMITFSKSQMG